MIDLGRGLRHMAWANDRFLAGLASIPDAALTVSYAPDAWPVARLATHIVGAAEWYRYCLTGAMWTDIAEPVTGAQVEPLRAYLGELDAVLLEQAALPEAELSFVDEDGPRTALRSTLLTQAIVHAGEHRAQIACALAAHGFAGPSLDDIDLWAFEAWERASG